MSITIPKDPTRAVDRLAELTALIQSKEWSKAATVYALIRSGMSKQELAAKGITGLRSRTTVTWYYQTWENAIKQGKATEAKLGSQVEEPDLEFPQREPSKTTESKQATTQPTVDKLLSDLDSLLSESPDPTFVQALHERIDKYDPEPVADTEPKEKPLRKAKTNDDLESSFVASDDSDIQMVDTVSAIAQQAVELKDQVQQLNAVDGQQLTPGLETVLTRARDQLVTSLERINGYLETHSSYYAEEEEWSDANLAKEDQTVATVTPLAR